MVVSGSRDDAVTWSAMDTRSVVSSFSGVSTGPWPLCRLCVRLCVTRVAFGTQLTPNIRREQSASVASLGSIKRAGDSWSVVSEPKAIGPGELPLPRRLSRLSLLSQPVSLPGSYKRTRPPAVSAAQARIVAALDSSEDQRLKGPFEKHGFGSSIPRFYRSPMHVQGLDFPVKLLLQQRERQAALLQRERAAPNAPVQRPGWQHSKSKSPANAAGSRVEQTQGGEGSGGGTSSPTAAGAAPDSPQPTHDAPPQRGPSEEDGAGASGSAGGDYTAGHTSDKAGGRARQLETGPGLPSRVGREVPTGPPAARSRRPSRGALERLVLTTAGLDQYSVRPTTAGVTIRGEPGPGAYDVKSGPHVTAGVRVVEPGKESFAFRASSKRFRKHRANPVFVPQRLHDEEYDRRDWANPRHGSPHTFAHSKRVTMQAPGAGRRPSTAHLFYSTMVEAPTDISKRLHTTPVRYAAGARTKFTRFPMSQLHPQYSVPIGPGSFRVMASYDHVGVPHDPVRGSAVFRSSSTRFRDAPKRELVGDDWHYDIFDSKIQVQPCRVALVSVVTPGCYVLPSRCNMLSWVCAALHSRGTHGTQRRSPGLSALSLNSDKDDSRSARYDELSGYISHQGCSLRVAGAKIMYLLLLT